MRRLFFLQLLAAVVLVSCGLREFFIPESQHLTGSRFELREIAFEDDTGFRGEGYRSCVYRISSDAADALAADDLSGYPMWSGLAFDGYTQMKWKPVAALTSAERDLLTAATRFGDAASQASSLMTHDDTLVAAWYQEPGGGYPNYRVYILNLKQRVLIKLSLLS